MHAEDVIPLFLPIMKSLGLLHKQGMIHRDISPDNFIIDFQNHLWLIDFGAAGVSSNRRQQMKETASDQTVIVKAGYTPLEQYRKDGKIGSHTDVYALCATMYTAFTGHTLPDAITRIQKNDITPITTIPEWQWKALSKGLSVNLQDRYLNMGELIDGLTVAPVARYDTQREKLAGRYKTKTAMYEALMFLLIWYSVSTTLFQMIRSKIFISDCVVFFDTIATFTQTIAGWVVLTGKTIAQISNGISNSVVAGIIYWLIRILVCSGCLVGVGLLAAFIGIKTAGLYKKCCWDMITILVILISMAIAIYFGDWIKAVLPINLLFILLFVQLVYVGIRWYMKGWRDTRNYY